MSLVRPTHLSHCARLRGTRGHCPRERLRGLAWRPRGGRRGGKEARGCGPSQRSAQAHVQAHLKHQGPTRTQGPAAGSPARPPPRLAAFPATPGFVPVICTFSSSPHCGPNHTSFFRRGPGKGRPELPQGPEAWLLRPCSPSLPGGRGCQLCPRGPSASSC